MSASRRSEGGQYGASYPLGKFEEVRKKEEQTPGKYPRWLQEKEKHQSSPPMRRGPHHAYPDPSLPPFHPPPPPHLPPHHLPPPSSHHPYEDYHDYYYDDHYSYQYDYPDEREEMTETKLVMEKFDYNHGKASFNKRASDPPSFPSKRRSLDTTPDPGRGPFRDSFSRERGGASKSFSRHHPPRREHPPGRDNNRSGHFAGRGRGRGRGGYNITRESNPKPFESFETKPDTLITPDNNNYKDFSAPPIKPKDESGDKEVTQEKKKSTLCCDLCDISVTTIEQLQLHLVGSKHRKTLRKRGLEDEIGTLSEAAQEVNKALSSDAPPSPRKLVYCRVCRQSCPHDQLGPHIASSIHSKAESEWRFRGRTIPSFKHLFSDEKLTATDMEEFDEGLMIEEDVKVKMMDKNTPLHCEMCKVYAATYNDLQQHFKGKKHQRMMFKQKESLSQSTFYCDVCSVNFSDQNALDEHFKGRSHAWKVLSKEMSGLGAKKVKQYECHICEMSFVTEDELTLHFTHDVHAENVRIKSVSIPPPASLLSPQTTQSNLTHSAITSKSSLFGNVTTPTSSSPQLLARGVIQTQTTPRSYTSWTQAQTTQSILQYSQAQSLWTQTKTTQPQYQWNQTQTTTQNQWAQTTQSQWAQSQTTQPQWAQSQTTQPQWAQSQTTQPQWTQSQTTQSQWAQSQTTTQNQWAQSQTTQPQWAQSQTTQPQWIQSQTAQPQWAQSQTTTQNQWAQSQTTQPQWAQSQTTQPQWTQSQTTQPQYQWSQTQYPSWTQSVQYPMAQATTIQQYPWTTQPQYTWTQTQATYYPWTQTQTTQSQANINTTQAYPWQQYGVAITQPTWTHSYAHTTSYSHTHSK